MKTTTTTRPKELAKLHTTQLLCTFLPSMCRTRTTETNEKLPHEQKQTAQNTPTNKRKHTRTETNRNHRNNKTLPQHHLQLTSTRHKTNALNKLIRFVVPLEIMSTVRALIRCHTKRKSHDKHHPTMTETHQT